MLAIALALGSSLAWGVSDFLGGLKGRTVPLLGVLLVSQGAALILLSLVVASYGQGPPGGAFLLYAALAGTAEAVGVAALYRGLSVGVMSIVAPVAATAPVVPVIVGLVLGEIPSPIQGVGIALGALGIVVTARRDGRGERGGDPMGPDGCAAHGPERRRSSATLSSSGGSSMPWSPGASASMWRACSTARTSVLHRAASRLPHARTSTFGDLPRRPARGCR